MNAHGYRSIGTVLCANALALLCTPDCQSLFLARGLLPNRAYELVMQDEWQTETRFRAVWSVCTAMRTVLWRDGHQMHAAVYAGGDENVRRMCALPIRVFRQLRNCAQELRPPVRRPAGCP
jgi:hypothetical protein